jgi:hypothetical protein
MAHYAILDKDNKVIFVTPIANEKITQGGVEVEQLGIDFLFNTLKINNLYPEAVTAKQTSYNSRIRNKYAGIGDTYDAEKDVFISPQPYPSWTLNETIWEAPKAMPTEEGKHYYWDESKLDWVEINLN